MRDVFADERLQFFLRNRDDIKAWAAIESEVLAATRELLAQAQPRIEERLAAIDPNVVVGRNDNGQWERVLARYEGWPPTVGLALEWNRAVDLLGGNRPKLGVFWWAEPTSLVAPRSRFVGSVDKARLQSLGFKVPLESVWPVGQRVTSAPDWWRNAEAWLDGLADRFAAAWPLVAPAIDDALQTWVSGA